MEKKKYQSYINNFRRRLASYLKQNIGFTCNIFPSEDGGGILEFVIGDAVENDDTYKEKSNSLGAALSHIEQKAFGGNLEGLNFGGTNTILEANRIILIKESNLKEWSDEAAAKDVGKLLSDSKRGGA